METTKSLIRDEINKNCERTLILLRSNKPEAADLMLNMLNDTISKRYGDSRPAIDVSKFSKLKSENNNSITKVPSKKPKLKKIKKEKNTPISRNETKLNEQFNGPNIQDIYQKTKHISNKFNSKISKHNKFKSKIMKDENDLRHKNKYFEKANSSDNYVEETINNTSQTSTTTRNLNNKTKSNIIFDQNENIESLNGTQENKIQEIQNTEKSYTKGNESSGMSPTVKKTQLQQKPATKLRSHKKPPLHELSSRQRIQAILEKGINNK